MSRNDYEDNYRGGRTVVQTAEQAMAECAYALADAMLAEREKGAR